MSQPRVAVLDYEAGNVRSAQRGLVRAGADAFITGAAEAAATADAICIPGVGHFAACLAQLRRAGLVDLVERWVSEGRPVLGICVGMQLLYEGSDEGDEPGLGLLPGRVLRLPADAIVPHMGWDTVTAADGHADDPALAGVADQRAYFVHSYYAQPSDDAHVVATCDYGGTAFPCVVRVRNVLGTQFHPEKSGEVGAALLANWVRSLPHP